MEFKQFKNKLDGFIKSQRTQRDNLQELIVAGLEHYRDHGDTGYLSLLIQRSVGVKSVPTKTITEYIKVHANVRYVKLKDGAYGFQKATKDQPVEVEIPAVVWYEWKGGEHNKPKTDYDWEASIARLRQTMASKLEDGSIKKPEQAARVLGELDSLLDEDDLEVSELPEVQ